MRYDPNKTYPAVCGSNIAEVSGDVLNNLYDRTPVQLTRGQLCGILERIERLEKYVSTKVY